MVGGREGTDPTQCVLIGSLIITIAGQTKQPALNATRGQGEGWHKDATRVSKVTFVCVCVTQANTIVG